MKKSVILALLFVGIVACDTPETVVNTLPLIQVSTHHLDIVDTTHRFEIHLSYPEFSGEISASVTQEINTKVREMLDSVSYRQEFEESHIALPDSFFNDSDWRGHLQNTFSAFQCDSLLTVHFFIQHYYLGAAHGASQNKTLHFNLHTGALLPFDHFFDTRPNQLAAIKQHINGVLADSVCWGIESDTGIAASLSNFIPFKDSIIFKFNDYDLCPYALGITEITIPTDTLKGLLKKTISGYCTELQEQVPTGEIATH